MRTKLTFDPSVDVALLFQKIKQLEDEDPLLMVTSDLQSKEITIGYMGAIQLEVLKMLILERFGFDVDFESPQVVYKETLIGETVYGCGHFEPLRHYAEVHVTLEPIEAGSGIVFESVCHAEDLPINYVSQVKHSVLDGHLAGVLTGSELTDVRVTLVTGRAHVEHTAQGDFYEATIRAVRHGLEQGSCVLLEPLYRVVIAVPNGLVGRIMMDLSGMHGTHLMAESKGEFSLISGTVPIACFGDYATTLASLSSGKGRLRLQSAGFAPCHNQEEVVARKGYQRERDVHFSSSSVFCAKGKGYTVPWQEAQAHMHCPLGEKYKR